MKSIIDDISKKWSRKSTYKETWKPVNIKNEENIKNEPQCQNYPQNWNGQIWQW